MEKENTYEDKFAFVTSLAIFGFFLLMTYYALGDKTTTWDTFFCLFSLLIGMMFVAVVFLRRIIRKKTMEKSIESKSKIH